MMPTAIHAFSQEEIMAYLDGELSVERALAAAQHLEQCRECQRLAADLQNVSLRLADWEIESSTSGAPQLATEASETPKQVLWKRPAMLIAIAAVLFLMVAIPGVLFVRPLVKEVKPMEGAILRSDAASSELLMMSGKPQHDSIVGNSYKLSRSAPLAPPPPPQAAPSGPLIVRNAQLSVTSKNFDRCRADVERITIGHQGYIAQLDLNTSAGAGRSLNATLRVPAAQLDAVLRELAGLGHVDEESQRGEDVTQHSVDLNARLSNLRTTEERLQQILRERTGRLADVLQVEEAVDRTRGEIEVIEAEQKTLSNQIAFAAVQLKVSETYKVPLEKNETSVLTRLRNAAVEGYQNVVEGAIGVLAFLLSTGPALFVVLAIAFFPARWLWRRSREGWRPAS